MASTLEQLLSIQGTAEQQSIDSLINGPHGLQESETGTRRAKTQPMSVRAENGPPGPQESPPHAGESASMLEAWRSAYRIFTKYAPALRRDALARDDNTAAGRTFVAASEEINQVYRIGGDAKILAVHIYGMLEDVYNQAARG